MFTGLPGWLAGQHYLACLQRWLAGPHYLACFQGWPVLVPGLLNEWGLRLQTHAGCLQWRWAPGKRRRRRPLLGFLCGCCLLRWVRLLWLLLLLSLLLLAQLLSWLPLRLLLLRLLLTCLPLLLLLWAMW